jgi:hypothetical protein
MVQRAVLVGVVASLFTIHCLQPGYNTADFELARRHVVAELAAKQDLRKTALPIQCVVVVTSLHVKACLGAFWPTPPILQTTSAMRGKTA